MRYATAIPVGRGGMGEVAKAWDPTLGRWVALKFLRHPDPELEARMVREARAQAQVTHPNVCSVYEVGERDGRPFIAMQYIDGEPLDRATAPLPLESKLALVKTVAEAVHAAHSVGLIHRDLKPGNILVEEDRGGVLQPYVVDFGIARTPTEGGLTVTGQMVGTPGYVSPEQARGETGSLDRRSDVYSLGVVSYELLSGSRPHTGTSDAEVLASLLGTEPRPLRQVAPHVPRDLESIVMRCLEFERDRRYDSARELAEDLGRFLDGEPVHAHPVTAVGRLWRKARRNRTAAALAGAATVTVLTLAGALLAGGVKYTLDLERERTAALEARREAEDRAKEAQEIAEFLTGLFEVADPSDTGGETLTARQILDRGVAELESELGDQPITRAGLLSVMGTVYGRLGQYDDGRRLLEEALAIQRAQLGIGHPRIADTLVRLGEVLRMERRFEEASELLGRALRIRLGRLGPDHPDVATVQYLLGRCLRELGDLAQAETLIRQALDTFTEADGPDSRRVLNVLLAQAAVVQSRGDPATAAALYAEVLDRQRRVLGPDDPALAPTLNNLAYALRLQDDYEGAERAYREALALDIRLHGEQHPYTLQVLQNLAGVLHSKGDRDGLEEVLRRKIAVERSSLPPDHWRLGSTLVSGLGRALIHNRKYREAESVLREGLGILETALGADHSWVATGRGVLAASLYGQGRDEEADDQVRASLDVLADAERFSRPNWASVETIVLLLESVERDDVADRYRALLTEDRRPGGV